MVSQVLLTSFHMAVRKTAARRNTDYSAFCLQVITAYRLTQKGEPFQGHDVALDALASLITHLVVAPELHVRASLGVSTS